MPFLHVFTDLEIVYASIPNNLNKSNQKIIYPEGLLFRQDFKKGKLSFKQRKKRIATHKLTKSLRRAEVCGIRS